MQQRPNQFRGRYGGIEGGEKCYLLDKKRLKGFWRRAERLHEEGAGKRKSVRVSKMEEWWAGSEKSNYVMDDESNMTTEPCGNILSAICLTHLTFLYFYPNCCMWDGKYFCPLRWEHYRYTLRPKTKEIILDVLHVDICNSFALVLLSCHLYIVCRK